MNNQQRANLLKLANYLESLPASYKHFDMSAYARYNGDSVLSMPPELYAVLDPKTFLGKCGTVACAVGHGPAAGIELTDEEQAFRLMWYRYSARAFGADHYIRRSSYYMKVFDFLFSADWAVYDNHHYGAAARIRYLLDGAAIDQWINPTWPERYAPYRKGSESAKRQEIDCTLKGNTTHVY
jgi:hypothetical protein